MKGNFHIHPSDEAMEKIENYIVEHQLKPDDKLPSERELCEMWGFNRNTLRNAINHLVSEGKLYRKRGSGTFVNTSKIMLNLQELKSFSQSVIEAGRIPYSKVLSFDLVDGTKKVNTALKMKEKEKVWVLVRVRGIDQKPVLIETAYLSYSKFPDLDQCNFSDLSLYEVLSKVYGIKLHSGVEKIGITYTNKDESDLLMVGEEVPVFFREGTVYDENDEPVEYFKSVARSDYVYFGSELKS